MSVARSAKAGKSHADLVREFPLRPIRSEREFGRAMKIAGQLAIYDEGTLGGAEQDYLDTLTVLLEDYDRTHCSQLPEVTPLEMLKHLMEEHEMNISDLGRLIGSQSNASLILSGKREISKRVIQILSKHFKVDPAVFIENTTGRAIESKPIGSKTMKIELNDQECYIAATVLQVQVMTLEHGIMDEGMMEDRHSCLEKIKECRDLMEKIDLIWKDRYDKVHARKESDRFVGVSKGPAPRRELVFDFKAPEFQALIESLDNQEKGFAGGSIRSIRALRKKLEAAED